MAARRLADSLSQFFQDGRSADAARAGEGSLPGIARVTQATLSGGEASARRSSARHIGSDSRRAERTSFLDGRWGEDDETVRQYVNPFTEVVAMFSQVGDRFPPHHSSEGSDRTLHVHVL